MRVADRRSRRGAALFEALVALTILATAGVALVALVLDASRAVERARDRDSESRHASAFLHAVALWTRTDLDRHLGPRRQGRWLLHIDRPTPTIYSVTLTDSGASRVVLETALYRRDGDPRSDDAP